MSDSPLLGLPYLAASQAQKHVTHNEALSMLDGLVHLAVASRLLATPPGSPADGVRYLIAASPTGDWAGHGGQVALRLEGAWRFFAPREGWRVWVSDEDTLVIFDGAEWNEIGVPTELQNLSLLGVNATADATNKLSVSSSATLFNHMGNGHQVKINKNAGSDTASFLFQSGFSARAEFGTTGDDDFHLKVSPDGSSFSDVLIADRTSGRLTVQNTLRLQPQASDPASSVDGQLWFNSTSGKFRVHEGGVSKDMIGGGGLADGDYGDVTVSGGGTAMAVDMASSSSAGKVELATDAETITGTDAARALTPANLAAWMANGHLKFPATQNPSADANTLDDYEEGTWTPGMTFGGSATGVTYSAQIGTYTKIGRLVFINGQVSLTNNGSGTGTARITGLPFVAANSLAVGAGELVAGGSSASGMRTRTEGSTTNAFLTIPGSSADAFATDTNCTNTFSFIFSFFFQV